MNKIYNPFSFMGSFIAVFCESNSKIAFRSLYGGDERWGEIFSVSFEPHAQIRFELDAIEMVVYNNQTPLFSLIYEDADTIRLRLLTDEISFLFTKDRYDHLSVMDKMYEITSYLNQIKVGFLPQNGHLNLKCETNKTVEFSFLGKNNELFMEFYKVVPKSRSKIALSYEDSKQSNLDNYNEWCQKMTHVTQDYEILMEQSIFTLWRNMVKAKGLLSFDALYMSKNDMNNVWSWDHYFSAIGLRYIQPEIAFQQLLIFEKLQDDSGAFPDYVNDTFASYNCVKPPLLGWTYSYLMEKDPFFKAPHRLERIVNMCEKQLEFYLNYRQIDKGLFFYKHGNDSGWDNGTFFIERNPVISPDLSVYLITTCDFLTEFYEQANRENKANVFKELSDVILSQLISELWNEPNQAFLPKNSNTKQWILSEGSLMKHIPLLIANKLPQSMVQCLLEDLENFECPYGLATEKPKSHHYAYNGYWRGPVWAPTTFLFVASLMKLDKVFAVRLMRKFLSAVETGGFAENFDPFTGEGLVDSGFAWTASVALDFLIQLTDEKA